MLYVGIFLFVWFLVGFVIALKAVFVDRFHEYIEEEFKNPTLPESEGNLKTYNEIKYKKTFLLAVLSLLGFYLLYLEIAYKLKNKDGLP